MMKMSKIWEILRIFKDSCKDRGWKTSENEDLVEADECYHNFLWIRGVHVSSFKKIASARKCVVREGMSYRLVEVSCTAWLFSETPSETLIQAVVENPELLSRTALYDLSGAVKGKNRCTRLNYTDSPVFQEFENFLEKDMRIHVKPFSSSSTSNVDVRPCSIEEPA